MKKNWVGGDNLPPIIVDVENSPFGDETHLPGPHFPLPDYRRKSTPLKFLNMAGWKITSIYFFDRRYIDSLTFVYPLSFVSFQGVYLLLPFLELYFSFWQFCMGASGFLNQVDFLIKCYSANGWLSVWGPVVWIPGIPLWKGLLLGCTPIRIPNHRAPNQQLTISWVTTKKSQFRVLHTSCDLSSRSRCYTVGLTKNRFHMGGVFPTSTEAPGGSLWKKRFA